MSKPYRIHVDHDGWRWIGTPDQPTGFVALPHTSMHAAHRIVEELNGLLHAHDEQKARAEKAETALDEAIARADKTSNALIRTTAALRETTTRAEKAEARVAELRTMLDEATDRSDLHFNNLSRTLANQRDEKQAHALTVAKLQARVAELERDVAAWSPARHYGEYEPDWEPIESGLRDRIPRKPAEGKVWVPEPAKVEAWAVVGESLGGEPYTEGVYATEATARDVADARNVHRYLHDQLSVEKVWVDAKTAPQPPVPAPEGTETAQKAPPPSPTGAPGGDQWAGIKSDTQNPGPVLGHPRASESSSLDTPIPRPSRMPLGIVEAWQDGDRVFGTYAGGPQVELVPVPPDDGPVRTFVVKDPVPETNEVKPPVRNTREWWCMCGKRWAVFDTCDRCPDTRAKAERRAKVLSGIDEAVTEAIHDDGPCVLATIRVTDGVTYQLAPLRRGLPSRDEVAAFLEARWPK